MTNIIEQLDDLIVQATLERSHYYARSVAEAAKATITALRKAVDDERERCAKICDDEGFCYLADAIRCTDD